MKKLYTLFILLLGTLTLCAQAELSSVKGEITEPSGTAAAFATVSVHLAADESLAKAGYSNEAGIFELNGIPSGTYIIKVTYIGYADYTSGAFELIPGEEFAFESIALEPASEQLEEVVVTAKKPLVEIHPDKTVFNVEGSINSTGNNALELLRKSPGVIVDNSENIQVSGRTGLNIYIDGKQSPLQGADLAAFLKSLQAEDITSIEIITNPSAKYDAEGNAGIIDIRLKKDKNLGANANINLGYDVGVYPKYNGSARVNYRNKKFNAFGSYSMNTGKWKNWVRINRQNSNNFFDIEGSMINDNFNNNFRAGFDYFATDKSTIGVLVHGYYSDNSFINNSRNEIYLDGHDELDQVLIAKNTIDGNRKNINFNLNYAYRNENGTTINIDADYGVFANEAFSYQPNTYYDPTEESVIAERNFANDTPTDIDIGTFKTDYERNAWGGKLGAGFKVAYVETDNIFDFYDEENGDLILNEERSNEFRYTENVNAGYVSYKRQLNKWNLSLGLRVENTNSEGDLTSTQQTEEYNVKRNYTDFFPSGGVSYQINEKNSLRLNYSRRIDRPNYQDLNPFEFKLDELTFRKGNAFLNPQYTNSVELTYTHNYSLNISLSYAHTTDFIANITDTLSQVASFITLKNIADQKVVNLNVSYPFTINEWWSVYANATAFYLQNKGEFEGTKVVDISATTVNLYAQNTFKLPMDFTAELSFWYQSPSVWGGNFETDAIWNMDFGIQKQLLDGRATVKVAVSDIFYTNPWRGVNEFGALRIDARGGWESRRFKVNFTYNLGNQQVKASRRRKAGLEEENSRIKTDNG